jgi:hypothetical protein
MLKGHVVNNTGRCKHIFKKNVYPGEKVALPELFELYKIRYGGTYDVNFIRWLEENKIPENSGFNVVINDLAEDDCMEPEVPKIEVGMTEDEVSATSKTPNKLTAKQVSELKIKDSPKKVIQGIVSIHKLRRALTLCKDRAGKETLVKFLRERITELT